MTVQPIDSWYPLGRWTLSETSMGASVHTRHVPEGEAGGYYLYDWGYGDGRIILTELVKGTTKYQRLHGQRSFYAEIDSITVDPALVRGKSIPESQEAAARLIFADMQRRFGGIAEWITYDTFGKPVWFHGRVIGES